MEDEHNFGGQNQNPELKGCGRFPIRRIQFPSMSPPSRFTPSRVLIHPQMDRLDRLDPEIATYFAIFRSAKMTPRRRDGHTWRPLPRFLRNKAKEEDVMEAGDDRPNNLAALGFGYYILTQKMFLDLTNVSHPKTPL